MFQVKQFSFDLVYRFSSALSISSLLTKRGYVKNLWTSIEEVVENPK